MNSMVTEGLDYFEKSGDAGDAAYVDAIRLQIRELGARARIAEQRDAELVRLLLEAEQLLDGIADATHYVSHVRDKIHEALPKE